MTKEFIQSRINEVRDEIKRLQAEEKDLCNKLNEVVVLENTKLILSEVNNVTRDNSMVIRLHDDTRTTPIMDDFFHSDKRFLVFDKIFSLGRNWSKVSLVVTKGTRDIKFINSKLTMTELKKHANIYVTKSFLNCCSESARFYPLAKELVLASNKITDDNSTIQFENVIRLGGQTYLNQTGYGSIYEGSYRLTQGTLYGDTTSFYIIGIKLS